MLRAVRADAGEGDAAPPVYALDIPGRLFGVVRIIVPSVDNRHLLLAPGDEQVARSIQQVLSTQNLRVYTSSDIVGVQMGGVVKNIIAIAAGVSDGLSLGQNARAALITRGLAEMTRLAVRMGGDPATLAGLPGLGDLILTCAGDLSRNRAVGLQIAHGKSLQGITASTRAVAEGVTGASARSANVIA